MNKKSIVVFTAKSRDTILQEGGTSSWRLDRNNARRCQYAVCTRNAHADWVQGREPHHSAFLVGKVKDVIPSPENERRYLILFSEYAEVKIQDVWTGDRNPVHYVHQNDLPINFEKLNWQRMPEHEERALEKEDKHQNSGALTIEDAKQGLSRTFGVPADSIEITIRG